MEHGVVPGPQGTRWHALCLVCGGKREVSNPWGLWKGREEKGKAEIGCGKKLDSAAKSTKDGNVWCRECLVSYHQLSTKVSILSCLTTAIAQCGRFTAIG